MIDKSDEQLVFNFERCNCLSIMRANGLEQREASGTSCKEQVACYVQIFCRINIKSSPPF